VGKKKSNNQTNITEKKTKEKTKAVGIAFVSEDTGTDQSWHQKEN